MKKPNPEPQRIEEYSSVYFNEYEQYTLDNLRQVADSMERDAILSLEFRVESGYNNADLKVRVSRLETAEQAAKRYASELKDYERYTKAQTASKEKRKKQLIKEAKELGLKVQE